ncbi:MAG TPA: capsule biosynthesis protein [Syntrophobacteraceae bacterium]|nr:capsule biosynthesis protein [Syntrophobacteraceae bacterium]
MFARLRKMFAWFDWLFAITVFIPTMLAILYWGVFATDIYVSESHFIVRSEEKGVGTTSFNQLLQTAGFSHSQDDTNNVNDYVQSRPALTELEKSLGLMKIFTSPNIDRIRRFAGLTFWDRSFESFFKYYYEHIVELDVDTSTSISTLLVRAPTAEEAYSINEKLLELSEDLINALNKRVRVDMVGFATSECEKAVVKCKKAAVALSIYRNKQGIFDINTQSGLQLQNVTKLEGDLVSAKTELAQILSASQNNPAIPVLKERIKTLRLEIDAEMAKVAGSTGSLTYYGPEYEQLQIDNDFAQKLLSGALTTLEQARNEALRKELYLQRIVEPVRPDYPIEPRRMRNFSATFILGMLSWGILALLLAGIREHHE